MRLTALLVVLLLLGCSSSTEPQPETPRGVSLTFLVDDYSNPDAFSISEKNGLVTVRGSYRVPQGGYMLRGLVSDSGHRHELIVTAIAASPGFTIPAHFRYTAWLGPLDPGDHVVVVTNHYPLRDSSTVVLMDTVTVD